MSSSKKDIKPALTVAQYTHLRNLIGRDLDKTHMGINGRIIKELDTAFAEACGHQ